MRSIAPGRLRDAFAPYSGLFTFAGIAMMIVFGARYIQMHNTLEQARIETSTPALVTSVADMTCTRSMATTIQSFNVKQRCVEVYLDMEDAPGNKVNRRIVVEQNAVGDLVAGDSVYVIAADTGVDSYMIINAHDRLGFFLQRYSAAGYALFGALIILASFLIKRSGQTPGPQESVPDTLP